jgi:hypothetical protein
MGHVFDLESPSPPVGLPTPRFHSRRILATPRASAIKDHPWSPQPKIEIQKSKIFPVPSAVAIAVWEEASVWLDAPLPRRWIGELIERADAVYRHSPRFRQLLRQPGNAGRDWLWSFTRHWLAGLLIKHRPALAARLPSGYKIGHPLPSRFANGHLARVIESFETACITGSAHSGKADGTYSP